MKRVRFFGSSHRWTVTTSFTIPTVVARASEDATTCQVIRNGTTERKDGGLLHVLHRVLLPKRSQLETTPPLLAGKAAMRSVAGSSARAKSLTEPDALARAEPLAESHALALAGRGWGLLRTLSILGTELLLCAHMATMSEADCLASYPDVEFQCRDGPHGISSDHSHSGCPPNIAILPAPPAGPASTPILVPDGKQLLRQHNRAPSHQRRASRQLQVLWRNPRRQLRQPSLPMGAALGRMGAKYRRRGELRKLQL